MIIIAEAVKICLLTYKSNTIPTYVARYISFWFFFFFHIDESKANCDYFHIFPHFMGRTFSSEKLFVAHKMQ